MKNKQYVDYINNTGQVPLPVHMFDEDWEPIGPMLRRDMAAEGLIADDGENIILRADLVRERP